MHDRDDAIASILEAIFPTNSGLGAVLYHFYCDESGTHAGSPMMTMAGYLFESRQARLFAREWQQHLKTLGLSAAHMTDCALGFGEYEKLSLKQRIKSEMLLIRCKKKYTVAGQCISINEGVYNKIMADEPWMHSAYSFLLMLMVLKIRQTVTELFTNTSDKKIMYFFESGHNKQAEANRFMNALPPDWRVNPAHVGHAFVDKKFALPLQAADMFAWQHRHFLVRRAEGHDRMRKDFDELIQDDDYVSEVETRHIMGLRSLLGSSREILQGDPAQWQTNMMRLFGNFRMPTR